MSIKATDNAFKRVMELGRAEVSTKYLRITVDGGGCSGFVYNYSLVTSADIASDDYILENFGTKIIVDPESKEFMADCIIDYVEELSGSSFIIKNPNAKAKCGCGNSFSI